MDSVWVPPLHVMVDVPHDLPVICLVYSPNDGLSIGLVDADLLAEANVIRYSDVRLAESSFDMSRCLCERLPPARMNPGPAGVREAASDRRSHLRGCQQQSDRLDAWQFAESNLLSGRGRLQGTAEVFAPVDGLRIDGRYSASVIDILGNAGLLRGVECGHVDA